MRILNVTNDSLVIQARNQEDYAAALQVAETIQQNTDREMVLCSSDDYELWVQVTACWSGKQAQDFRDEYTIAKKNI